MHSQNSDLKKIATVESQAKSSNFNSITLKTTNNQIGTMTKRKQNTPSVHQSRLPFVNNQNNSSTIDITVVHAINKSTVAPTISITSNSPSKHLTQSKSQHVTTGHHLQSAPRPARLTDRNGRKDINEDPNIQYCNLSYGHNNGPFVSVSSSHIPNHPFDNPYLLSMQCYNPQTSRDVGNRQHFSNRQNHPIIPNRKSWPNPRTKRSSNNNSTSSDKSYSSGNDNNNNNDYTNKPNRYVNHQVSRNNKSYNCDTSKNISPVRDNFSSSSSSSSTSSIPLAKKSIHHPHSPVIPQLISFFQGDSRTPHSNEREMEQVSLYAQWPSEYQYTGYENGNDVYGQFNNYGPLYAHSHIHYMDPSNGNMITFADTRSNNHRVKQTRHRSKNGMISTNSIANAHTTPDRYMHRAAHIELTTVPEGLTNASKWDRLSKQVWDKFLSCQQKKDTYLSKIRMWKHMHNNVMKSYTDYALYVVGSTISGFGSDNSDVDMCLVDCSKNNAQYIGHDLRHVSAKILKDLEEMLKTETIYADFNLITAKVPILRFKDTIHECEIDLNYNNYVGLQNTHLLYCYGRMDWRLRPLVLVVKLWARFHGINNAKEMTISSYSLVLMVIHFLQCGVNPPVLPCLHDLHPNKFQKQPQDIKNIDMNEDLDPYYSKNKQTLGELFEHFFSYYTNFEYSLNAISVRTGNVIPIESCRNNTSSPKNDPNQWKELCIEEPFDFTNTAHSCYDPYKFHWIHRVFELSFQALHTTKELDSIFDKPFMPLIP